MTPVDAEVDRLTLELVNVENGLDAVIDELRERGRSPALSAALVESEALKDEVEARLVEAVARQTRTSPASQERRRANLAAHLGAPAGAVNVKLRAVFARVLPDWRDGRVRFRWTGGEDCGESLVFAWPKGETSGLR